MSTIVNQANDNDIQIMAQLQVSEAYETYRAKLGDFPRPEEDVTPEQLSGMHELYKSKSAPYVDLAVWGPFSHRLATCIKLSGMVIAADGQLKLTELSGPPTFEDWEMGFKVFKTVSSMCGQLSPAVCDHWARHIKQYATQYGPHMWHII